MSVGRGPSPEHNGFGMAGDDGRRRGWHGSSSRPEPGAVHSYRTAESEDFA